MVYVCLEGVNGLMNRLDALQVSGFKIDPALFASCVSAGVKARKFAV